MHQELKEAWATKTIERIQYAFEQRIAEEDIDHAMQPEVYVDWCANDMVVRFLKSFIGLRNAQGEPVSICPHHDWSQSDHLRWLVLDHAGQALVDGYAVRVEAAEDKAAHLARTLEREREAWRLERQLLTEDAARWKGVADALVAKYRDQGGEQC